MQILQIVPSLGRNCGIAFFADTLGRHLGAAGARATAAAELPEKVDGDVVLLHHHPDLLTDEEARRMAAKADRPFVLLAHAPGTDDIAGCFDGTIAMAAGAVPPSARESFVFPHPAPVFEPLEARDELRARFGIRGEGRLIGTFGFLRFERRYAEIAERLVPHATERGWFVQVLATPWRLDSPGVIEALSDLRDAHPQHIAFEHRHLDDLELSLRLQACDLLWCWTDAPSSPYGSGAISQMYASGTRVYAADKLQHEHVLRLDNAVRGPATLDEFIAGLITEAERDNRRRHDPSPIGWPRQVDALVEWLAQRRRPTEGTPR